ILEWHKQEGEPVAEGETVVEVSTDKVDAEVPAPASGTIAKILAQPDETVQVGQVLAELIVGAVSGAPAESEAKEAPERPAATQPAVDGADGTRASPVAGRIAAASGVDLGSVPGSGPGGKVTKADVLAAANGEQGAGETTAAQSGAAAAAGEAKPLRGP